MNGKNKLRRKGVGGWEPSLRNVGLIAPFPYLLLVVVVFQIVLRDVRQLQEIDSIVSEIFAYGGAA